MLLTKINMAKSLNITGSSLLKPATEADILFRVSVDLEEIL